jgi:antitoxin (DNA-binding transcriptional repressor) of toxin-antitoxin stability system
MQVISAREFRTNQSAVLRRALKGESILLTSRLGSFKITPVTEEDSLTSRIFEGLREVKLIESGKLKGYTVEELLDEL